jgi:hypothetical protein
MRMVGPDRLLDLRLPSQLRIVTDSSLLREASIREGGGAMQESDLYFICMNNAFTFSIGWISFVDVFAAGLLVLGVTAGAEPDLGAKKLLMSLPPGFLSSFLLWRINREGSGEIGEKSAPRSMPSSVAHHFNHLLLNFYFFVCSDKAASRRCEIKCGLKAHRFNECTSLSILHSSRTH